MEYDLSCEVCFREYNGTTVIPLVLDCGHSFCKSCISELVDSNCPKCRTKFLTGKAFPVNHSFMSLIEECKKPSKDDSLDITCRIQNLSEKLNNSLSFIESDIKNLRSVSEDYSTEELAKKRKARKELKELEEKYKKLFMNTDENLDIISTSFSLLQSGTKKDFLQEVYKALKNSEKVFAMKPIDKKLKFGEMMVRDNKILISSLTLDKIPDGAKTVLFQDLNDCTSDYLMHTFLEITGKDETSQLIIIKLQDLKACPHFIKLCTAESGPSYHDKRYLKYEDIKVWECACPRVLNIKDRCNVCGRASLSLILYVTMLESLPTDYCKNTPMSVACIMNEVIVIELKNDGFGLKLVKHQSNYKIMGKVIYPSDISHYISTDNSPTPKILNCGIVLEL